MSDCIDYEKHRKRVLLQRLVIILDMIRNKERAQNCGNEFIEVYQNDYRDIVALAIKQLRSEEVNE